MPEQNEEKPSIPEDTTYLYNILFSLVKLDLLIVILSQDAYEELDRTFFEIGEVRDIEKLLPVEEIERWIRQDYFQSRHRQEDAVRRYIDSFHKDRALRRLRDLQTLPYISRAFYQAVSVHETRFAQRTLVQGPHDFTISQRARALRR